MKFNFNVPKDILAGEVMHLADVLIRDDGSCVMIIANQNKDIIGNYRLMNLSDGYIFAQGFDDYTELKANYSSTYEDIVMKRPAHQFNLVLREDIEGGK